MVAGPLTCTRVPAILAKAFGKLHAAGLPSHVLCLSQGLPLSLSVSLSKSQRLLCDLEVGSSVLAVNMDPHEPKGKHCCSWTRSAL